MRPLRLRSHPGRQSPVTERVQRAAETPAPAFGSRGLSTADGERRRGEPGGPAVEVTALIRDFGTPRAPIHAVDNLDLTVRTGEIYGFLGPNGAGKTTLVRMRPTSGSALVAGYDVVRQADDVRRSIAWRSRRRRSTRS